ncbi:hypothetical protein [Helicobacter rodentium]|uniref:hypothetical protein n=1 Tax=Helicobacter rodentium TaxID=59617 RepID=UPI0025B78EB0|nr:hypothetical protein [Helicobacter rodentium]
MKKVSELMMNAENGFLDCESLKRAIGEKYQKRLKEKPNFWHKNVESVKMDFTLIPQHDERLAFWLIRKGNKLVIQCFVFAYHYSAEWQLILSEEFMLKDYDSEIYDVAAAEKKIMEVVDKFLEAECKNDKKDDEREAAADDSLEVEFFDELPKENDARLKDGQVWRVNQSKGYSFKGYYYWDANDKKWLFESDLE